MRSIKVSARDRDIYGVEYLFEAWDFSRYRITLERYGERKGQALLEQKQPGSNRFLYCCYFKNTGAVLKFLDVHKGEKWRDIKEFTEEIKMGKASWDD